MSWIKYDPNLKDVDLKDYLIKDMDNPKQMAVVDALLAFDEKLRRILPLHQRQIISANNVYSERCLK